MYRGGISPHFLIYKLGKELYMSKNYDNNNSDKLVHVNAYNRSDGTFVKEHWRGKGESFAPKQEEHDWPPKEEKQKSPDKGEFPNEEDIMYADKNGLVLEGGVEKTDLPSGDWGGIGDVLFEIIELLPTILQLIAGFSGGNTNIPILKGNFDENILKFKEYQNNYKTKMDNLLKNVVMAPNQEEYSKQLKEYVKVKDIYDKTQKAVYKVEHHVQNNEYKKAQEDIQSLQQEINASFSIPKEQQEQMQTKQMLAKQLNNSLSKNNVGKITQKIDEISKKSPYQNALSHKNNGDKLFFNKLTQHATPDAAQFWNLFSNNFDAKGMEYINQNGQIVPSIKNLPPDWQNIVHKKVKQQMGLDDCVGIIFNENSSISKSIADSDSLKLFLSRNLKTLLKNKILRDQSMSFNIKEANNAGAIGRADIPVITVDNEGNIKVVILDTYDFNPNSKNPIVKFVFPIQQWGLGNSYYSLILIHLTLEDIFKFFI